MSGRRSTARRNSPQYNQITTLDNFKESYGYTPRGSFLNWYYKRVEKSYLTTDTYDSAIKN